MTKKYNTPMLQIVSINKKDIIATSNPALNGTYTGGEVLAPDRNMFDSWNEGF